MSEKIKFKRARIFKRARTNLKVGDYLKGLDYNKKYRVIYIDLNKAQAVLTSISDVNEAHILDLDSELDDFVFTKYS